MKPQSVGVYCALMRDKNIPQFDTFKSYCPLCTEGTSFKVGLAPGSETMQHIKKYYSMTIEYAQDKIIVEGPVSTDNMGKINFHPSLNTFRPAKQQEEAITAITTFPEAKIMIAKLNDIVIGYIVLMYPSPLERWSEIKLSNLLELAAIEVAPAYRDCGIAKKLLSISLMDQNMEDYIIFATTYVWHWDLKGTSLNVWQYRELLDKMMNAEDFFPQKTTDPEVNSHPANRLLVRIGNNVDEKSLLRFNEVRLQTKQYSISK